MMEKAGGKCGIKKSRSHPEGGLAPKVETVGVVCVTLTKLFFCPWPVNKYIGDSTTAENS